MVHAGIASLDIAAPLAICSSRCFFTTSSRLASIMPTSTLGQRQSQGLLSAPNMFYDAPAALAQRVLDGHHQTPALETATLPLCTFFPSHIAHRRATSPSSLSSWSVVELTENAKNVRAMMILHCGISRDKFQP